jgi:hypothetical protein
MKEKLFGIGKGAGIAAAGAVLAYLGHWATGSELGVWGPLVAAAATAALHALNQLAPAPDAKEDQTPP